MKKMKKRLPSLLLICFIPLLHACSFAPTYHRPPMNIPAHYKESGKWIPAKPTVADLKPGPWWKVYGDPRLNELQESVILANQSLQAALARYQEASAAVTIARADYFPSINGIFNFTRQQVPGNISNKVKHSLYSDYLLGTTISYEVDVWGRVRNAVAASQHLALASAADTAALQLSLQTMLASYYFSLRETDAARRVLDTVVHAYAKALFLVQMRHKGGIAPIADVDEAKLQLENAKTLAADIRLKRAQLEHAIAILIGEAPANFSLKPTISKAKFISIAPRLPSTLLERRPDIAAAERRVAAANANIGIARSAFFPAIFLTGQAGFESTTLSNLISMPSLYWSIGPSTVLAFVNPTVSQVLYDGGRLRGLLDRANASYFETVANYRQTVLTAFQEVEDSLAAVRQLEKEYQTQASATRAAKRALKQAIYRYRGGIITYLDVVIVQNQALQSELAYIDIRTRRQLAGIQLIKALGGGFEACPLCA